MSELFKSEFFTDEATVYNLKDSMWLGKPSKSNEWWFGVQNTDATDEERKEAAKFIANAINTRDTMQASIVELKAVVRKIHNIVGVQSEQGACWDDEVAFEHSEAVLKVFEISKQALKDNS
tara:strand:- start:7089 stop:7451 length:363 start_codon:yes stop_codon:yes gene_type:complete